MKKKIITTFLVLSFFAACNVWAQELNKDNVRAGLSARITSIMESQGVKVDPKSDDIIKLERVVQLKELPQGLEGNYYAIRALVSLNGEESVLKLVVDETGKKEISVNDVATGESLLNGFEEVLSYEEFPEDMGGLAIYSGTGENDVVMFSNPFCPYCSTAIGYMVKNLDTIKSLKVVHMVNENDKPSQLIDWIVRDGIAADIQAIDLITFPHRNKKITRQSSPEDVVTEFRQEFPKLDKRWGDAEQTVSYLKAEYAQKTLKDAARTGGRYNVTVVPRTYINGIPVDGWNQEKFEELLSEKEN